MSKKIWFCLILCIGCAAEEDSSSPSSDESEVDLNPAELAEESLDERRALFAARLDPSELALGPLTPVEAAVPFDESKVLEALSQATGASFTAQREGGRWSASSETHDVEIDLEDGTIDVASEEGYIRDLKHAPDAMFETSAKALFSAIASDTSEANVRLMHLGATTRVIATGAQTDARIGTKVFAIRRLGGLRVANSRMVASFNTDGKLRAVRGRWPEINLKDSKLTSSLTQDQVLERALNVLADSKVTADDREPIRLESFYELQKTEAGTIAVLRAAVLVRTRNAEGELGRGERHDFDL